MTIMPTREEWQFTDSVPIERRAYLERDPSFDDIARRIVSEGSVEFCELECGTEGPVINCKRASFKVNVAPDLCDLFFNGRGGYRAQYWRSRADGEFANRTLIEQLKPKLLAVTPAEYFDERPRISLSLEGHSAKVWIWEKGCDRRARLVVKGWRDIAIIRPTLKAKVNSGRSAVLAMALVVKGAFISDDESEHIASGKVDRSRQIHLTGWT